MAKKKRIETGYSRVTSVLGYLTAEWLQYWWRSKGFEECDRVRDEATTYGKKVHKFVEEFVAKSIYPSSETVEGQRAITICRWLAENKVVPLGYEVEVKDSKLKLIGHFDLLAEIGGEKYVVDYKTSKKVDKTYALQLSAYSYLIKKTLKLDVNKGIILRIDKVSGELEVVKYENLKPFWTIFRAGLMFYKFMNGK